MKLALDLIQTLLSYPWWVSYPASIMLIILLFQAVKLLRLGFKGLWIAITLIRFALVRLSFGRLVWYAILGLGLYGVRFQAIGAIQYVEQWISPVYVTSDTSGVTQIYEMHLSKHTTPDEYQVIRKRTAEIAAKVGSTPLALYEVYFSECGMDIFTIRKDGIAAGPIQFTTYGLTGLGVSLNRVKEACKNREAPFLMDLTEKYLIDRSKGKPMPRACDVYCAVFAPGYLAFPDSQVLYSGWDNASYYLNDGLDCCKIVRGNQIFYSRLNRDGSITIEDLRLTLEYKKAKLLKMYE